MKVGVSLFAQNYADWDRFEAAEAGQQVGPPVIPDGQIYEEQLRLGKLVEPLGYDSLWTVEHHFTPYTMVNNPLQFLSYFAGCTERIDMGTMVIVLPWHNPIRVVEEVVTLDHLLGGRELTLGLGRGAGRREFTGLGVDMDDSRELFLEQVDILRAAFSSEYFSYTGKHYTIPRVSLRPTPRSTAVLDNLHCAWGSPSSVPVAAEAGLQPFIIPQMPWPAYVDQLDEFNQIRARKGWEPARPKIVCWVYCAETEEAAAEGATRYMAEYADSALRHYELTGEHFGQLKDYQYYAELGSTIKAMGGMDTLVQAYLGGHIWGTPEQCIERLVRLNDMMAPSEFIAVMQYGTMPSDVAERNMRLFADEVLPSAQAMQPAALAAVSATT